MNPALPVGRNLEELAKRVTELELQDRRNRLIVPEPVDTESADMGTVPGMWYVVSPGQGGAIVQGRAGFSSTLAARVRFPRPGAISRIALEMQTAAFANFDVGIAKDGMNGFPDGAIYLPTNHNVLSGTAAGVREFVFSPPFEADGEWAWVLIAFAAPFACVFGATVGPVRGNYAFVEATFHDNNTLGSEIGGAGYEMLSVGYPLPGSVPPAIPGNFLVEAAASVAVLYA